VSSPVKDALESYVAGRVKPERLVIAISAAYYGDSTNGNRESLQPLIDVIDRASPGIVELGTVQGGSGFAISLAERPFPKQYEAELRRAAEAVLRGTGVFGGATDVGAQHAAPLPNAKPYSGMIGRLLRVVRRLFRRSRSA